MVAPTLSAPNTDTSPLGRTSVDTEQSRFSAAYKLGSCRRNSLPKWLGCSQSTGAATTPESQVAAGRIRIWGLYRLRPVPSVALFITANLTTSSAPKVALTAFFRITRCVFFVTSITTSSTSTDDDNAAIFTVIESPYYYSKMASPKLRWELERERYRSAGIDDREREPSITGTLHHPQKHQRRHQQSTSACLAPDPTPV